MSFRCPVWGSYVCPHDIVWSASAAAASSCFDFVALSIFLSRSSSVGRSAFLIPFLVRHPSMSCVAGLSSSSSSSSSSSLFV